MRIQETGWIEVVSVGAINVWVSILAPYVRDDDGMITGEIAVVPIVLDITSESTSMEWRVMPKLK